MAVRAGQNLADKQHVIARRMQCVMPAFEPGRAAFDQRRAGFTEAKRHAREPVRMRAREAPCQSDLIVRQYVDGITLRALECGEAARAQREAPDDERWIERYGIERVGGEADEAVGRTGRDDRDARRELRQCIAELPSSWRPPALSTA